MGAVVLALMLVLCRQVALCVEPVWMEYIDSFPDQRFGLEKFAECTELHLCDTDAAVDRYQEALTQYNISEGRQLKRRADGDTYCACEGDCDIYDSCCEDVPDRLSLREYSDCLDESSDVSFYAVTRCPADAEPSLRALCESDGEGEEEEMSKPSLLSWIVTSNTTCITYRSVYCALCHGEEVESLSWWDLDLWCSGLPTNQTDLANLRGSCKTSYKAREFEPVKCLPDMIEDCLPEYPSNHQLVEKCRSAPQALVVKERRTYYRNIYCALCNNITDLMQLECPRLSDKNVLVSWRILVHPFGADCEEREFFDSVDTGVCDKLTSASTACDAGRIFDWATGTCLSICPPSLMWVNGRCVQEISSSEVNGSRELDCTFVSHADIKQSHDQGYAGVHYDDTMISVLLENDTRLCANCSWIIAAEKDVVVMGTDLSLVETDSRFQPPFYVKDGDNYRLCQEEAANITTVTNSNTALLGQICLKLEETVTYITLGISLVCLVVMVIVYALLPSLHNLPGYLVLGQVITLLLGYTFFLLRVPAALNADACYAVSVILHYLLIATSFWSFLFAVEIVKTVTSLYAVNQKSGKKLARYVTAGLLVPALPVLVAVILDHVAASSHIKRPSYGQPQCWFNSEYGLYLYFLLPIAAIFSANLLAYLTLVVRFSVLAYPTRQVRGQQHEKLWLSVKLFFAFGLLWVFGIASAVYPQQVALSCIFLFVNSLNGLLLMLVFVCNAAVLGALKRYVKRMRCGKRADSVEVGRKVGGSNASGQTSGKPTGSTQCSS